MTESPERAALRELVASLDVIAEVAGTRHYESAGHRYEDALTNARRILASPVQGDGVRGTMMELDAARYRQLFRSVNKDDPRACLIAWGGDAITLSKGRADDLLDAALARAEGGGR